MDAVQKANSGHPGAPMALAPLALPALHAGDEAQPGRTRTGSTATASCSRPGTRRCCSTRRSTCRGYGLTLDDLKNFRQLGSPTAGHPEYGRRRRGSRPPPARSARASRWRSGSRWPSAMLAARFNRGGHELIDHHTYAIASDGDMQEGVASEASLAGRPPRPRQADRLLRQQPHPARRRDRDGLQRGRGQALRGLRLARAGPGRGPLASTTLERAAEEAKAVDRPALAVIVRIAHRLRLAEQAGHLRRRTARRSARTRCGSPRRPTAGTADKPLLRARRGARATSRRRPSAARQAEAEWDAAARRLPRRGAPTPRPSSTLIMDGRAARRLGRRPADVQPGRRRGGHPQGVAAR